MLPVVSVGQMREMEKETFKKQNISSFDLMVYVGQEIFKKYKSLRSDKKMLILAGTGNNGGDALVFGEQAHMNNHQVKAYIIGDSSKQSKESLAMTKRYIEKAIPITHIKSISDWDEHKEVIESFDLLVDGLFGIGLDRPVSGLYERVIEDINQMHKNTISIDVPSGLHANNGCIMGVCVKNTSVYTIQAIKQGLVLEDAKDVIKDLYIVDANMEKASSNSWLQREVICPPKRKANSHKYHYKNVLTIGGQKGVMGAITLAGLSALRSGAGLSTIATNKEYIDYAIVPSPELMVEEISNSESLQKILRKKDAVLFGLGMREITPFDQMVFQELVKFGGPLVLDASALLLVKSNKILPNKRVVLTPHYGEFAKLMGISVAELKTNPMNYIEEFLRLYPYELILKGPTTIYATKDRVIFLDQGTPALAKAGSGDVLAGIVLTYVARDLPIEQAVLLHMLAGKKAEENLHTESVFASDLIKQIPSIYQIYTKEEL